PPHTAIFPYTTLFRSPQRAVRRDVQERLGVEVRPLPGKRQHLQGGDGQDHGHRENEAAPGSGTGGDGWGQSRGGHAGGLRWKKQDRKSTRLNSSHGSI